MLGDFQGCRHQCCSSKINLSRTTWQKGYEVLLLMGMSSQNNYKNISMLLNLMINEVASRTSWTVQVCRETTKVEWNRCCKHKKVWRSKQYLEKNFNSGNVHAVIKRIVIECF